MADKKREAEAKTVRKVQPWNAAESRRTAAAQAELLLYKWKDNSPSSYTECAERLLALGKTERKPDSLRQYLSTKEYKDMLEEELARLATPLPEPEPPPSPGSSTPDSDQESTTSDSSSEPPDPQKTGWFHFASNTLAMTGIDPAVISEIEVGKSTAWNLEIVNAHYNSFVQSYPCRPYKPCAPQSH